MADDTIPADKSFALNMEVGLKEDIVEELEDFVLYTRLGLIEEALDLIDNVLWRHISIFVVFAEVGSFLAERRDLQRLSRLFDDRQLLKINLTDTDDKAFFNGLKTVSRGFHAPSDLSFLKALNDGSTSEVLLFEISLLCSSTPCSSASDNLIVLAQRQFEDLLTDNLQWEATRIFSFLCLAYPVRQQQGAEARFIVTKFNSLNDSVEYKSLVRRLDANNKHAVAGAICALLARVSLMLFIVRIYDEDVSVLLRYLPAGLPPLRQVYTEAMEILTSLMLHEQLPITHSIYFNLCNACMENWKWSEAAALTIRRLNEQIQKFNNSRKNLARKQNAPESPKESSESTFSWYFRESTLIPPTDGRPVTTWFQNPPMAA